MIPQVIANGVIASALVIPVSLGLFLIYRTHRFMFFAFGAVVTVSPYVCWFLLNRAGCGPWFAGLAGVGSAALLGMVLEVGFHIPARRKKMGPLAMFLLSLGCYVVVQNLISLGFGNDILSFRERLPRKALSFGAASFTDVQLFTVLGALLCAPLVWAALRLTRMGRCARAVANSDSLSRVVGINVAAIYYGSMCAGCLLGGLAGICAASDMDLTPTMGMMPLMMGLVAVLIGGSSLWGTVLATVFVGMSKNVCVIWLPTHWQDAVVFVVLLAYLVVKPRFSAE
jgi:branched-subunit amino acid ABC-type transport system permease component